MQIVYACLLLGSDEDVTGYRSIMTLHRELSGLKAQDLLGDQALQPSYKCIGTGQEKAGPCRDVSCRTARQF